MSTIKRRTIAKAMAWSVPAVAVATAAPAYAASTDPTTPPLVQGVWVPVVSSTDVFESRTSGSDAGNNALPAATAIGYAFDDNTASFWHSGYAQAAMAGDQATTPRNSSQWIGQWTQTENAAPRTYTSLVYTPRQIAAAGAGRAAGIQLQAFDGTNWNNVAFTASATLNSTYQAPVTFTLTSPTAAFGLRLLAVTTYTWNGRGNLVAAEIDFNYT